MTTEGDLNKAKLREDLRRELEADGLGGVLAQYEERGESIFTWPVLARAWSFVCA